MENVIGRRKWGVNLNCTYAWFSGIKGVSGQIITQGISSTHISTFFAQKATSQEEAGCYSNKSLVNISKIETGRQL